jgi:hypothetical protein
MRWNWPAALMFVLIAAACSRESHLPRLGESAMVFPGARPHDSEP